MTRVLVEHVGDVCVCYLEDSFIVSIHRFDSEAAAPAGARRSRACAFRGPLGARASRSTATGSATAAAGLARSRVQRDEPRAHPQVGARADTAGAGAGSRTRGWAHPRRRARRCTERLACTGFDQSLFFKPRAPFSSRRRERTAAPEESLREARRAPRARSPSGATRTALRGAPRRRASAAAAAAARARARMDPPRVAPPPGGSRTKRRARACDSASRVAAGRRAPPGTRGPPRRARPRPGAPPRRTQRVQRRRRSRRRRQRRQRRMRLRRVPRIDARVRKRPFRARGGAGLHAHRDFERRRVRDGAQRRRRRLCFLLVCPSSQRPRRRSSTPTVPECVRREGLARAPHRDHPDAEVAPRAPPPSSSSSRRREVGAGAQRRRARRGRLGPTPALLRFPGPAFLSVSSEGSAPFRFFSETNIALRPRPAPEGVDAGARAADSSSNARSTPRVAGERVHLRPQRLGVRARGSAPDARAIEAPTAAPVRARGIQERGHVGNAVFGPGNSRGRSRRASAVGARTRARGVHDDAVCVSAFSVSGWPRVSSRVTTRRRSLLRRAAHEPSLVDVSRLSRVLLFPLVLEFGDPRGRPRGGGSASMAATFSAASRLPR